MQLLEAKALGLGTTDRPRRVGRTQLTDVSLGDTTITREVMHPGWRWSDDIRPVVGTDDCRAGHQLYIVSGRMQVVMRDAEIVVSAGDAVVIPPGHDAWVVGEEPVVALEFQSAETYAKG